MDCTHCGSTLGKDTLKFCPYCGEQVAQGDVQSAPPENPVSDAEEDKSFSETAWFMSAVTPESLADGEGEALDYAQKDEMNERYELEQKLPNAVRKEFSLKTIPPGQSPKPLDFDDQ